MHVHLLAIGTRMPDWVDQGTHEYVRRLAGDIRLHVQEIAMPRRHADTRSLMAAEAQALDKHIDRHPGALTVAMEVKGRRLETESLARRMGALRDEGRDLLLLVGGPDGLDPALSARCHERWSLSDLTLPHPLVRVLLAEQIYRCWSLLSGHPYHR